MGVLRSLRYVRFDKMSERISRLLDDFEVNLYNFTRQYSHPNTLKTDENNLKIRSKYMIQHNLLRRKNTIIFFAKINVALFSTRNVLMYVDTSSQYRCLTTIAYSETKRR